MTRFVCAGAAAACALVAPALAGSWHLGPPVLINTTGTRPSVWNGTVAYLDTNGGAVMFYDGTTSFHVYGPNLHSYEPANSGGSVAWRNVMSGASSNEIFRWDGQSIANVSNNSVLDSDLAAAGNGDLMWSQNHTWLMYYEAATDDTDPVGVRGVHPSVYVTGDGVVTYAYQDPDTDEVKYFDGATTHTLGAGAATGAYPSLWDGAVTWVGTGVGGTFLTGEIFFWKNGQSVRLTNDDAVNGIADAYPHVWNDLVVWSRSTHGAFANPTLVLWDGTGITELIEIGEPYTSFQGGQAAWATDEGLFLADLLGIPGDVNGDGRVDLADLALLLASYGACAGDPSYNPDADLDASGCVDLADLAALLANYGFGD